MRRASASLLCMLCLACGDDSSVSDAGAPVDARFLHDASVQACSAEMDECAALNFEVVCDLERGRCVECLSNDDCSAATGLGPTCSPERGTCECGSDEDCSSRPSGDYCHPSVSACGCINDDDCLDDRDCKLEPYLGTGIRTCQVPPV